MDDEYELTQAEWDALSGEHFAALLEKAWDKPFFALTDAVHWIATNGKPSEPDFDELTASARALVDALRSGTIAAFGIAPNGDFYQQIPIDHILSATQNGAEFFDDSNLFNPPSLWWAHDPGKDEDTIMGRSGTMWERVSVKRDSVMRLWASQVDGALSAEIVPCAAPPMTAFKTGAPGKPSLIQLVEREFGRRCETGEVSKSVTEEGEALHAWCVKKYPNNPAPTPKTIQNRIRQAYKAWKDGPHN